MKAVTHRILGQDGSLRIAMTAGAMLADPGCIGNLPDVQPHVMFDLGFWQAHAAVMPTSSGRGSSWFIAAASPRGGTDVQWVLRHYRRGGWAARVSRDRYLWQGEASVRAFAEFRLLRRLHALDLPVPRPVAACYRRHGIAYRCDLITERIVGAVPLSERLAHEVLSEATWRAIGITVARLHRAGVDHADLNAHNVLLDGGGLISVIDLDRSRLRQPGEWVTNNLDRLRRSLDKIARNSDSGHGSTRAWDWLLAGYADQGARGDACDDSTT